MGGESTNSYILPHATIQTMNLNDYYNLSAKEDSNGGGTGIFGKVVDGTIKGGKRMRAEIIEIIDAPVDDDRDMVSLSGRITLFGLNSDTCYVAACVH